MGTPIPASVIELVKRFSRNRRAIQSRNCRRKQSPEAKTPLDQQSLKRTIAATDKQIDALVCGL